MISACVEDPAGKQNAGVWFWDVVAVSFGRWNGTRYEYVFRCFTITELNGFRNTLSKWFMILGKLFRKGVYVLTQRFSGSF